MNYFFVTSRSVFLVFVTSVTLSVNSENIKSYIDDEWYDGRYNSHGNGTVTDTETGLMWSQCSLGQEYYGGVCNGDSTTHNWYDALTEATNSSIASYNDWRLPNIKELSSLAARNRYSPAINSNIFSNTPASAYWTSSPMAGNVDRSWLFYFGNGNYSNERFSSNHVRLVRSGQ